MTLEQLHQEYGAAAIALEIADNKLKETKEYRSLVYLQQQVIEIKRKIAQEMQRTPGSIPAPVSLKNKKK